MPEPETTPLEQALSSSTPGVARLVEAAAQEQRQASHPQLCVHHWLLALLERHAAMAESVANDLHAASLNKYLRDQLRQGNLGSPLDAGTALAKAAEIARQQGKARTSERDLAAAILSAAGYELAATSAEFGV